MFTLEKMASYFERKEEKTDCRGNRMAPHLSGQWLSKITQLHGREQKSLLHIFLRYEQVIPRPHTIKLRGNEDQTLITIIVFKLSCFP